MCSVVCGVWCGRTQRGTEFSKAGDVIQQQKLPKPWPLMAMQCGTSKYAGDSDGVKYSQNRWKLTHSQVTINTNTNADTQHSNTQHNTTVHMPVVRSWSGEVSEWRSCAPTDHASDEIVWVAERQNTPIVYD